MRNRWTVLIGAAIATMTSFSPAVLQTFGVYLKPMAEAFHWNRLNVSAVYSLIPLIAAPLMLATGALIDRIGNRPIIIIQAIGVPLVLLSFSLLQPSLGICLLVVGLGGLINSASTPASINSVLLQWFDRRLGLALGLSMATLGIGTWGLPILASHWIVTLGWRSAFRAEAALVGLISVVSACALIWDNKAVLLARRQARERGGAIDGLEFRAVLGQPVFWRLAACFLLMGLMFTGASVHFVAIMTDRGVSLQRAAYFFSWMGIAQIAGRLICAAVLDRVRVIAFATLFYLFATVAYVLMFMQWSSALYLAPVFLGLAAGVEVDVMGLIIRRWFGLRAAGKVFSWCFLAFVLGSSAGPMVMGAAYDRLHSYQLPLAVFVAGSLCVAWLFAGVARYPQVSPRPPAQRGEIEIGAWAADRSGGPGRDLPTAVPLTSSAGPSAQTGVA